MPFTLLFGENVFVKKRVKDCNLPPFSCMMQKGEKEKTKTSLHSSLNKEKIRNFFSVTYGKKYENII